MKNKKILLGINEAEFGAASTAILTMNNGRVIFVEDVTTDSTNYSYDSWDNQLVGLVGMNYAQVEDWAYYFFSSLDEEGEVRSYGYRRPWVQVTQL